MTTGSRTLIGGLGNPWLRDLDFGTQFVRRVAGLEWPDDVVLEDLSYSAHRVLHTLQDIDPAKVVLVCGFPRDDEPGTVRSYELDLTPPPDDEVHERLTEAVGGIIDLDHTLAVVRYFEGFPEGTIIVEVEPADESFGMGFSDPVEASFGRMLDAVRTAVGAPLVAAPEPLTEPL